MTWARVDHRGRNDQLHDAQRQSLPPCRASILRHREGSSKLDGPRAASPARPRTHMRRGTAPGGPARTRPRRGSTVRPRIGRLWSSVLRRLPRCAKPSRVPQLTESGRGLTTTSCKPSTAAHTDGPRAEFGGIVMRRVSFDASAYLPERQLVDSGWRVRRRSVRRGSPEPVPGHGSHRRVRSRGLVGRGRGTIDRMARPICRVR